MSFNNIFSWKLIRIYCLLEIAILSFLAIDGDIIALLYIILLSFKLGSTIGEKDV